MDIAYHTTPGPYFLYGTHSGGFVAPGSPSPPLSLCGEPIPQLPMPDGSFGSHTETEGAKNAAAE